MPYHLHGAVAEGQDDNHRPGFSLGNKVVENHIGATHSGPAAGIVAEPMQQIQHGIRSLLWIVTWRSIDVVIPIVSRHGRTIEVVMNFPVRYVIHLPWQR